jgi:hypothetical protein
MAPEPPKKIPKRITRAWVRDNPEVFKELSKPPDECPVCLQEMRQPRSPLLGDYPTSCRHFCCRGCWLNLFARGPRDWKCPVCREPVTDWLANQFHTTVRLERFDRDGVRLFVCAAMHQLFNEIPDPMDPDLAMCLMTLGRQILHDAEESSDEDAGGRGRGGPGR